MNRKIKASSAGHHLAKANGVMRRNGGGGGVWHGGGESASGSMAYEAAASLS
jgi:hypothetical protein